MSFNPLASQTPGWYLIVDPEGEGERLDCFIARRLPRLSRSRAAKLAVYIMDHNGIAQNSALKKSTRLRALQHLWIRRPLPKEKLHNLEPPIIIDECEDFIVIDKPAGWVAHPTASRFHSAMTTWLKSNAYHAQPVHRLDSETSGLLICAKHHQAETELQQAFINQRVHKTYLGICQMSNQGKNHIDSKGLSWIETKSLGFVPNSLVNIKMGRGEKTASTEFQVLSIHPQRSIISELKSPSYALIKAIPHSGRQHQIRVHLSLVGLSLVGDKLYGPDEKYFLKGLAGELTPTDYHDLGHERHALHALSLSFTWQGRQRSWQSAFPKDLQGLLNDNQV